MRHVHDLAEFLAWYTAVNVAMYLISVGAVITMRDFMVRWTGQRFGLPQDAVMRATFHWLAAYKLGIILFALAPWVALSLMT